MHKPREDLGTIDVRESLRAKSDRPLDTLLHIYVMCSATNSCLDFLESALQVS